MYLVVPNGGYNADSLPVRVDLYHESAYVLFISYMAGITLFTHSHVVNGVTIVHSHPFKKGVEHSHTTVEFQLIHFLNHFQTTDAGILPVFASFIALLLCTLLWCPQRTGHLTPCVGVVSLRAPPSFRL